MPDYLSTPVVFEKFERRQDQSLHGRIAARRAVAQLLGRPESAQLEDIEITRDEVTRAPRTSIPGVTVSISHSGLYACAAAAWSARVGELGLDLELRSEPPDFALLPLAFSRREQALIASAPERYYQFWTAKEAVLKALKLGLTVDLRDVALEPTSLTECVARFGRQHFRIETKWQAERVYSLTQTVF